MHRDPETFENYRPLLFSIAYRMLGSAMEAEDMVQEAYLRYENARDIQTPKAFLTTTITRLCLDQLKSARTRRENYVGTWLPEPLLTGDSPGAIISQRESITMAFLVLLENLSPVERAVFLLREVFEYDYAEIASIVGKREDNCRRYYHRARGYLLERRPRFEASTDDSKKLIMGFLEAVEGGDVENLTHLLAEDIVIYGDGGGKIPVSKYPVAGRAIVTRLLFGLYRLMPPDIRFEFAEVNAAPSLLLWQQSTLFGVLNFRIEEGHIKSIQNILNPDKLTYLQKHAPKNGQP